MGLSSEQQTVKDMAEKKLTPPGCMWAQRPKHLILTVCLTDVKDHTIKVEKNKMFFKEIDPEKSKYAVRPREVSFVLEKAEEGPYWDRLLATKLKQPWLRVDFKTGKMRM